MRIGKVDLTFRSDLAREAKGNMLVRCSRYDCKQRLASQWLVREACASAQSPFVAELIGRAQRDYRLVLVTLRQQYVKSGAIIGNETNVDILHYIFP